MSTDDAYVDGDRATVTTKMLGRIGTLGADEGDTVQAGQLLVALDDADLRARLAQADAQLELARTGVRLAEIGEQRAEDDFDRATLRRAPAALRHAGRGPVPGCGGQALAPPRRRGAARPAGPHALRRGARPP